MYSTFTYIVWPFFVYIKMTMFQAINIHVEQFEWFNRINTIYIRKVHTNSNRLNKICHVSASKINFIYKYSKFCQNRPSRTSLIGKCTFVCLYTKNVSKILTKWEPLLALFWPYAAHTVQKKKNLQSFPQSQQHLLKNMHF